MTLIELKAAKDLFRRELTRLEAITVSCNTCERWKNQRCQQWDQVPPAEVKAKGCDEFVWDWIPF